MASLAAVCLAAVLTLAACGSSSGTSSSASSGSSSGSKTSGNKVLVLYFDQGENSRGAGDSETDAVTSASLAGGIPSGIDKNDILVMKDAILKRTGGDEYAVRINEPYAPKYKNMVNQAQEDQDNDKQFTFKNDLPDLSQYTTIFVGMPVWWGGLPQPMVNVFEQLDFSGKTIIPFGIHLGSRFGNMVNQIKQYEPNAKVSDDGLTLSGHTRNSTVTRKVNNWLDNLNY